MARHLRTQDIPEAVKVVRIDVFSEDELPRKIGTRDVAVGQKFGQLTVKEFSHVKKRRACWVCLCECGKTSIVSSNHLRSGQSKSCGCSRSKHDHRSNGKMTPEYCCWHHMKQRCSNKNNKRYKDYGGRGISVCKRWRNSFPNFLADVGPRPSPEHSLDRIDNMGNYEFANFRWATRKQQSRNKRSNRMLKHRGEKRSMAEWAEKSGISPQTLSTRINKLGWSIEKAITTPLRGNGKKTAA